MIGTTGTCADVANLGLTGAAAAEYEVLNLYNYPGTTAGSLMGAGGLSNLVGATGAVNDINIWRGRTRFCAKRL